MEASLEPAWVLSQRPYGNSGRLVELFTANRGRFSAVARGVHRKTPGGNLAQLLQLFYPLLVSVSGRSELKSLNRAEPAGVAYRPTGNAAMCGMYLNELLIRLLPRFDPHPTLFARYGDTLAALEMGEIDTALRRFEVQLLDELGYRVSWRMDAAGNPLQPQLHYVFAPDQGFLVSAKSFSAAISGQDLLNIADWLETDAVTETPVPLNVFKQVIRQALAPLLGDRPLRTRELARNFDWRGDQ